MSKKLCNAQIYYRYLYPNCNADVTFYSIFEKNFCFESITQFLIPDLAIMVFEYCWTQVPQKLAHNRKIENKTENENESFVQSCSYGNYERVSELLEEFLLNAKNGANVTVMYVGDVNATCNQGIREVCSAGYTKIAKLIVNHFSKKDIFSFCMKWEDAFEIAKRNGNKETAVLMFKKVGEYDEWRKVIKTKRIQSMEYRQKMENEAIKRAKEGRKIAKERKIAKAERQRIKSLSQKGGKGKGRGGKGKKYVKVPFKKKGPKRK